MQARGRRDGAKSEEMFERENDRLVEDMSTKVAQLKSVSQQRHLFMLFLLLLLLFAVVNSTSLWNFNGPISSFSTPLCQPIC